MATVCFYAPDPIQSCQLIPGGNTPANGGQLFFYAAGSSTKQTVYKDNAAAVAWSNPIVLDSGGNLPLGGEVWFPTGQSFKVIFAPANDSDPPVSPYWTKDNLSGINDVSLQTGVEWLSGPTPTFVSTTSFTVAGDQTLIFTNGRRVKTTNTGGTIYSTITKVSFAGVTTVTVVNDSGVLDAGLSAVFYGLLDPAFTSIDAYHINRKGTAVASAATTDIWGIFGDYVHITGTNTIFGFSTAAYAGAARTVVFDGALTLASSAALFLPGNFNISTAANDRASIRAETVSTAILTAYLPNSGQAPFFGSQVSNSIFAGPASGVASPPTFRQPVGADGASMVLLDSQTANTTTQVVFSQGINTVFDEYEVRIFNAAPTTGGGTGFQLRFANSSLAIVSGASYNYANNVFSNNSTNHSNASQVNDTRMLMSGSTNAVGASSFGWNGTVKIPNSQSVGVSKVAYWEGYYDGNVAGATVNGGGLCNSTSIQNNTLSAFQFSFANTTISTGTFRLYGIRKT